MRAWSVLVILALVTPAAAETHKLFDGYTLVGSSTGVEVRKGKRRATLMTGGELSDVTADAKAKTVKIVLTTECHGDKDQVFTADTLEARLLNHESLALHLKKAWAKAVPGFERATKLDPTWRLPAYNLASAHARLGATDAALAALAPWLTSEPIRTYVQVATDPELQPLLTTPALAAVRAKQAGSKLAARTVDWAAYSAEKKLIAIDVPTEGYLGCDAPGHVAIHDATGAKVAMISDPTCTRSAKHDAVVATILADLGFSQIKPESPAITIKDEGADNEKRIGQFKVAKLGVVTNKKGTVNVLRGSKFLAELPGGLAQYQSMHYLPEPNAMALSYYTPSDICARTDIEIVALPPLPPLPTAKPAAPASKPPAKK